MKWRTNSSTDKQGRPIDLSPIETLLARIRETYHPAQIWLFGSRPRGEAKACSDWDLFVVVPDYATDQDFDPAVSWRLKKDLKGVYADVIPCRNSEFQDWKDTVNTLSYAVAREGVLLYEDTEVVQGIRRGLLTLEKGEGIPVEEAFGMLREERHQRS